jgi:hypothetical protein
VSGVVHAGHVDAAAGLLGVPELRAPGSGDQAAVALGAGSPDLDDAARRAVDHACSRRKPSPETTGGRLHPRGAVHGVPGSGGCPGPGGAERLGPRGPRGVSLGVARRRRVPRLDPCWRSSSSVCCCGWCSAGAGRHALEASEPASPAAAAPPPRHIEARSEADARELTVLTFDHTEGAERAYADAAGARTTRRRRPRLWAAGLRRGPRRRRRASRVRSVQLLGASPRP